MKKPRKRLKLYLFFFFSIAAAIVIGIWMAGRGDQASVVTEKVPHPQSQSKSQPEAPISEKPARFCFRWGQQNEFRIYKLLEGDPQNPFISRNRSEEFEAALIRKLSADASWTIQLNHVQSPPGVEQAVVLEKIAGQNCEQIQIKRWYKFLPGKISPNEKGEMQIQYKRRFGETQQIARYSKGQGVAWFEAHNEEIPLKAELFSFLDSCLTTELLLKLQAREQEFKTTCAWLLGGVSGHNIQSQLATTAVVLKTPKETELSLAHEGKEVELTPFKLLATLKNRVSVKGNGFNDNELTLKSSVQVASETVSLDYEYSMPEPHANEFYGGQAPMLPRKASLLITRKVGEEVEQLWLSGEIVRALESYTQGTGSCEGVLVEKAVETVKYRKYPKNVKNCPPFELVKGQPLSNEFHRSLMALFREFTLPIVQERIAQNKAFFNLSMEKALKALEKEGLLNFQGKK